MFDKGYKYQLQSSKADLFGKIKLQPEISKAKLLQSSIINPKLEPNIIKILIFEPNSIGKNIFARIRNIYFSVQSIHIVIHLSQD